MNRFVRIALTVAAMGLVFSASEAQAQIGFSIAGGPTFPLGDAGDFLDMGYHVQASAIFSLPLLPIGIQADGAFNRFAYSDVDDANFQSLSGSINAVINLPTPGITPYLIGGVGYYNLKDETPLGDADVNDFGINAGAGVRLGLPGIGGVFAEARLHNVFTENESTRFVPVSLGIRF
ncbi:MAG TPA: outer membrane beta-barrel protein [Longimicrobiales bacterium]